MENKNNEKKNKNLERIVALTILLVLLTVAFLGIKAFCFREKLNYDHLIVDELNRVMIINENQDNKARYCDEAIDQCIDAGFIVENLTPTSTGYHYAYDQENNRFMLLDSKHDFDYGVDNHVDVQTEPWKVFIVIGSEKELRNATKGERSFSVYLRTNFKFANEENNIVVNAGIDVGKCEDVNKVTYNNDKQQDVVIVTTGGELVINDTSKSSISHYDKIMVLDIVKCHVASYHEYGEIVFANIKAGHIAFEEESSVEALHFEKSGTETVTTEDGEKVYDTFDQIIVSYANGVLQPDYSRDAVKINPEGTKVCTLSLQEETNNVYLTMNGIYEQVRIQETTIEEEIAEGSQEKQIWVNTSDATIETKIAADQISNMYGSRMSAFEEGAEQPNISGINDENGNRVILDNTVVITETGATKEEVIDKVTVNSEFANYIRVEAISDVDIIKNKTNYGLVEAQIKELYNTLNGNFNNIAYGVYYDNSKTTTQQDDMLYLRNGRTYIATEDNSYLQNDGKYQYWHGDFVVKFNKSISAFTEKIITTQSF